ACPDSAISPVDPAPCLRGVLQRSGSGKDADILLRAEVRGAIETPCSRCLEPARVTLAAPLTMTFVPRSPGDPEEAEDPDVVYYSGDEIDLGPEVRDEILLGVPLSPLCREDCQGLCSVCGGNRNLTPCDCEARKSASVFKQSAFAKLKV
ncbi:MAG TPA: DUF177 domain-containing protein, partial [Polyangia bacterium]|nr:DUF177 domain-containing protein [Polyangia bacterium]